MDMLLQEIKVQPIWCLTGNISKNRKYGVGGNIIKSGTKHFAPNTKVYCFPALWGDGYLKIKVISRHRGSHEYVEMIVDSAWIENWRVQLVYSHLVISKLQNNSHQWTKDSANKMAESIKLSRKLI